MSLPPGLWALPVDMEPGTRSVLEDLIAYVDQFDDRLAEVLAEVAERDRMAAWVAKLVDGADARILRVEDRVEELADDLDALRGEIGGRE